MARPGDLCDSGCVHFKAEGAAGFCSHRAKCLHLLADSRRDAGLDADYPRETLDWSPLGQIVAGETIKFLTDNVADDSRIDDPEWASRYGTAAFAGYKLSSALNDPIGVLEAVRGSHFTDEDDAFLENLAKKATQIVVDFSKEDELRQAQKLEGVGQLAGGVAHEFNNLLQVIEGYTRYGMQGLDPDEQRFDDLKQVLDAADRAAVLTKQLLGFSRHKAVQLKSVDANAVLRDLTLLLRPVLGKLITLQTFFGENVGQVFADAVDLQQTLLNLCLNSRDAMPTGGIISIKTERVAITEIFRESRFDLIPGDYVVYSVTDTGAGIPREIQQRIFEPFFTTKEVGKGTGLGLSMVYGMVRQHRGAIQLESELGRGTTFKIYLPTAETRESDESERVPEQEVTDEGRSETILIAEDDPTSNFFIANILQGAGYSVLTALDGEEAIRVFDANRGLIALAILDIEMPKRTGEEVCAHILEAERDMKIIFCSNDNPMPVLKGGVDFENIPLLRKPFEPRSILGKIRELLERRALSPSITEK
jgi:signal transduction histidine kinase